MELAALLDQARAWLAEDPDPVTRAELAAALEAVEAGADAATLRDAFAGPLAFGTAGLRGPLGAGPSRMNRVTVTRAAAGLAAYLDSIGAAGPVVVGYDARRSSDVFARDTAEVVTGTGRDALVFAGPVPTPLLAFAVRHLGAAAGVMVTASHNPAADNGYKVYLSDGVQIVPPADADIAATIAAVGPLAEVRRGDGGSTVARDVLSAYLAGLSTLVDTCGPKQVTVVHTALHGVASDPVRRALSLAGFPPPVVVPEQAEPDGSFPTTPFPNPEEPGALDLALVLAAQEGADLVVANDPDADRVAVALPDAHGWRRLSGDEVGALLADFLLARGVRGTFASSLVSSSLLAKQSAAAGQPHVTTLTGFKWIARVEGLAFGYEEALGYCVDPGRVRDKDGISALLRIVELAAFEKAAGRTLLDRLHDIQARFGVHATEQLSLRMPPEAAATLVAGLRDVPPQALGGLAVEQVDDLADGVDGLPPTPGLRLRLADGGRVVVRPSGTEPKLKCYLEVVEPPGEVEAARIAAAGRLDAIAEDLRTRLSV